MTEICRPDCQSTDCKKNGHIHNGKQNYRCKKCGRRFVLESQQKIIPDYDNALIKKALLEKTCCEEFVGFSLLA